MEHLVEHDRAIAKFLGYTKSEGQYLWITNQAIVALLNGKFPESNMPKTIWDGDNSNSFKYFTSLDALLPCLSKIESLGYHINILGNTCTIYDADFKIRNNGYYISITETTKLKAIYFAIVKFVMKHNNEIN